MIKQKKVGLSLSGGGYRAAAFHLGTLRKLDELGILSSVDVISTISGGSITGACYSLSKEPFASFDQQMAATLSGKSVIRYVLLSRRSLLGWLLVLLLLASLLYLPFTADAWISVFVLAMVVLLIAFFQYKLFPVSVIIERAYNTFFYKEATLSQLCEQPLLVIGSTNIQTCRQFSFSRVKMDDSSYSYRIPAIKFKHAAFPVARAVMASSCVPFAFAPVGIDRAFFADPADADMVNPQLVDGGVYDNQGIHRLTQKGSYQCDIIIASDAGNKLPFSKSYNNVFVLLIRTMDVFMQRIKNFQMMQHLYFNTRTVNKEIAYLSLGWDLENCIKGFIDNLGAGNITDLVIAAHEIPGEWVQDVKGHREELQQLLEQRVGYAAIAQRALTEDELVVARKVGTNLTKLSVQKVLLLSKHAANLTELQVKLYCPSLLQ
ncbi:hypothetical protein GWC95_15670 [Sediminibacterium roseum]|uniref:PNPLA domain-containing protein n=1 Tax=Sediminibacterium roseum TaxID=1978412 RepID=A0ABW9ZYI7_9BACT|nr:patatin-like phospholipase family protein [Sediminibacterium roseum]NCI51367.1 hypothetical protein [Sediminibacterium roseum]